MGKITLRLLLIYLVVLVISIVVVVTMEVSRFKTSLDQIQKTIILGNEYATSQVQDIDSFSRLISNDSLSKSQYDEWLRAMKTYCAYSLDYDQDKGSMVTIGTPRDSVFTGSFIGYLDSQDAKKSGYSPLNFGITYLDRDQLSIDMKNYIYMTLTSLEAFEQTSQYAGYVIDPNSVEVQTSLVATPVNIKSQKDYIKQIFGVNTPAEVDKNIKASTCSTIVTYDITYHIIFHYIPQTSFFNVSVEQANGISDKSTLYYPSYALNPGGNTAGVGVAKAKWIPSDYLEYKFRYTMTH